MHNHTAAVHQNPAAVAVPLRPAGRLPVLGQNAADFVGKRLDLRDGGRRADDEIIRQNRNVLCAEKLDILGLFAVQRLDGQFSDFAGC